MSAGTGVRRADARARRRDGPQIAAATHRDAAVAALLVVAAPRSTAEAAAIHTWNRCRGRSAACCPGTLLILESSAELQLCSLHIPCHGAAACVLPEGRMRIRTEMHPFDADAATLVPLKADE